MTAPDSGRRAPAMRPFQASDWIGAMVACPHCGQILKVIAADGPFFHFIRRDRWWDLTLADGEHARMWEDRKGVVLGQQGAANGN